MTNSLASIAEHAHSLLLDSGLPEVRGASGVPDLGGLDDDQLREAVVALERLVNTAQACQAQAIGEMGRRARAHDDAEAARVGFHGPHPTEEFIVDELALLLSCTKRSASYLYDRSIRTTVSGSVMRAWMSGRIDARKAESIAHTIARCGETLPDEVIAAAIDYASRRTRPQLGEWLRRREIAADPEAAEKRRQQALLERRVTIRPAEDGMSELWALLPNMRARQIQQTIDKVAREASTGDERNMDQRRADALVELVTGEIDPPEVQLQVMVSRDALLGASDEPGFAPGIGPITANEARELAGPHTRTVFRRLVTDPASGVLVDLSEPQYRPSTVLDRAVRARDVTCRFPGCRRSALGSHSGTDLDHTVPWPQGSTSAGNLAALCRRHHRLKHSPGWSVRLEADGAMTWTTPTGRVYASEPWQYDQHAQLAQPAQPDEPDHPPDATNDADPPPRE